MPIDSEAAARDAVQRWLDADDPGEYRVTALLDLGPVWRVMWAGVTNPGYVNLSRLDKATGDIEYDLANAVKIGSSARETFAEMMRTTVKPGLKELGLRVSGTTFRLPTPGHYAALSVQQSRANVWVRLVSPSMCGSSLTPTGRPMSPKPATTTRPTPTSTRVSAGGIGWAA